MATNTHTEHLGGGKPQFPPFNKETFASQLVWFVIFFVILYVLIGRFAIPRIGGIIEARRGRIEGDLAEANRLKEQSDAALKSYEKSLAETRDKLGAEAEARRKALEGQLNLKLTEAEKTIATTKTAAMTNVRGIAVDTATAIVERLIGSAPSGSAVEAAVADALKR